MNSLKVIICLALFVSACSSDVKNTVTQNEQIKDLLDNGLEQLKRKTENFNVYDSSYITVKKTATENEKYYKLPVSFFAAEQMNIYDVLNMLEQQYKINSYIADFYSLDEENKTEILESVKNVSFTGNMGNFLIYLGGLFGVSMDLENDNLLKVNFFVSKTYNLDQYLDSNKASASLAVGGGEGTSGGLTASTESTVESNTWEKVETFLDDAIGEDGRATILEDFSIVKVTARPWVIEEIDELFSILKKESQMQVSVEYRIVSLSKTKLNQLAVTFGIAKTAADYSIVSDLVNAISLSQVGGGLTTSKRSVTNRLDAIVQTISQDVISKGQFIGLPNRIMPINLTTTTSYIEEITREQDELTGDINQATKPGEIVTGLSMLILPKVLDDGRIQLTSGFTEKKLVNLATLDGIQLPTVDETETLSTVTIDSGSIEMIALYTGNTKNAQTGLQLLAAGKETKNDNQIIAVLIGADSYKLSSAISKRG